MIVSYAKSRTTLLRSINRKDSLNRRGWDFCMGTTSRELYVDQAQTIDKLREAIAAGERRIMLQSPTGSGKTVIAGWIFERMVAKGKRTLFCVPRVDLVNQTIESFNHDGIFNIGAIQQQHEMTNWDMPVQVASIDTLARRAPPPRDRQLFFTQTHLFFISNTHISHTLS